MASALVLLAAPASGLDRGADGKFDVRTSAHFVLHQDVNIDQTGGFHGSRRFEQNVLASLERAYESLDRLLGLRPGRKIDVVIYDSGIFDQTFSGLFRFSAAGFYNGVIAVRGTEQLTPRLQRVLYHELVHAALDAAAPSFVFPGWVNEGLAEWFGARALGKRGLSSGEWAALARASNAGALIPYYRLSGPAFGGFNPNAAQLAYLQSYAMIDFLARSQGERKLSAFVDGLVRTRNLDRTLDRVFRANLPTLESRLFAQIE
jgi:hypothetical protein